MTLIFIYNVPGEHKKTGTAPNKPLRWDSNGVDPSLDYRKNSISPVSRLFSSIRVLADTRKKSIQVDDDG